MRRSSSWFSTSFVVFARTVQVTKLQSQIHFSSLSLLLPSLGVPASFFWPSQAFTTEFCLSSFSFMLSSLCSSNSVSFFCNTRSRESSSRIKLTTQEMASSDADEVTTCKEAVGLRPLSFPSFVLHVFFFTFCCFVASSQILLFFLLLGLMIDGTEKTALCKFSS